MRQQLLLTAGERDMLTELLQLELEELPNEIHHGGTLEFRNELRERRSMVESLLDRIRHPAHEVVGMA